MITLQPITETNFLTAAALSVSPDQGRYVAPAPIILARAYAYRRHRASAWGVYDGCRMVGLALMEDLDEEPACYHLSELLIDEKEQGKGYGQAALALLLTQCRREGKYRRVRSVSKGKTWQLSTSMRRPGSGIRATPIRTRQTACAWPGTSRKPGGGTWNFV